MSKLYNAVEDSFLGKHIHEGAMLIHYNNGTTQMRQHPMRGNFHEEKGYTQEQYLSLLNSIDPQFDWEGQYAIKEVEQKDMTVVVENNPDTGLEIYIMTVFNVYEIEARRLESNDIEEITRANRFSEAVKEPAPKW